MVVVYKSKSGKELSLKIIFKLLEKHHFLKPAFLRKECQKREINELECFFSQ
jgi:hypothetical protein